MLFNSFKFALFLPVVFILYWFFTNKNLKLQNLLLLGASFFFYACWDYRFLFLLIFSISLDYFSGIKMAEATTKHRKRLWFWLSILINVGFLGFFKYYNFFINSFADMLSAFGLKISFWTLRVILPVGISFYTFHGLSYVIDIYKDKIKPERNFVDYAVFVSFFPLLVAGPIERATHLLPQIKRKRVFEYSKAVDGLRQILWGLFKKIVIADNCSGYVNLIFTNSAQYSGAAHILAALLFTFQIYCDFSGYSDIAIGTARLFGINLLRNFAYPYFSRDIAEFWRRWHISLSTWFRDYLYIPLGGSRVGTWTKVRNTFIVFLVSGFWHGANWTFIFWGFLNALYIMPSIILNTHRNNLNTVAQGRYLPTFKEFFSIFSTFMLAVIAWIFFRSDSIKNAFGYITEIFIKRPAIDASVPLMIIIMIAFFIIVEWIGREEQFALAILNKSKLSVLRYTTYVTIAIAILFLGNFQGNQFIYFQF